MATKDCALHTVDMLPGESVFRAYIGLIWFIPCSQVPLTSAVAKVQQGVNSLVKGNPILAGTLRDTSDTGSVLVEQPDDAFVTVQQSTAPYSLQEMDACGYDQNRFSRIFEDMPGPTPEIDGLPVLVVRVTGLACGAAAVAVLVHHCFADAAGAAAVAYRISMGCEDSTPLSPLCYNRESISSVLSKFNPAAPTCVEHVLQMDYSSDSASNLRFRGPIARCQFRITEEALMRLRKTVDKDNCGTNALILALLWRVWTRALRIHGSKCPFTYAGGPADMRNHIGPLIENDCFYMGNLIQPVPMSAPVAFVLDKTLGEVASYVHKCFTGGISPATLRWYMDGAEHDIGSILAKTDSPMLAFSNMRRPLADIHHLCFGMNCPPLSMQLRSFDAPFMFFAVDDGCAGFLLNSNLPTSVCGAIAGDLEFADYATLVY
ncbi:hypothetical protein H4R20_000917 [Coemansia guatemalensis]|uniref:Uncharacterized protein n=1 Tax=Coemansia guatemalensis TaxID=2761395 RepID=A0A9W8I0A4_9FUNG|nr:hypothetical protein H4R20_000917 [Coemansia guatemalensis]